MKFFIDYDGTLIDSSLRIYKLFSNLILPYKITYIEYVKNKRNEISNEEILHRKFSFKEKEILEFKIKWLSLIETEEYLKYNSLFAFTKIALQRLSLIGEIYLISNRQNESNLIVEMERFQINNYFNSIFATRHNLNKFELIKKYNLIVNKNNSYFIGDTGEDIITAEKLGIKSVGVLSGQRNKNILKKYNPDYLFNNILEFAKYICRKND